MDVDALSREEHVLFVASTAGQGEAPQNGRKFFKLVNTAIATGLRLFPSACVTFPTCSYSSFHISSHPNHFFYISGDQMGISASMPHNKNEFKYLKMNS